MDILIEELRKEHKRIFQTLDQALIAGINSVDGRQLLLSAENFILDHLIREDQVLYPKYVEACRKHAPIFEESEAEFHKGLLKSTILVTSFFNLLSSSSTEDNLQEAFELFREKLRIRIDWEENKAFKCCETLLQEA
jgi:hypothetical protein